MMSNLTTKLALKKMGIPSNAFNFGGNSNSNPRNAGDSSQPGLDEASNNEKSWPAWMQVKNLPLTVQPWLTPAPTTVPVAELPKAGDLAPIDRDRRLAFGNGRRVLVVFLRCVGCAFAQKTFLALRAIANRYAGVLTCIAISHSSEAATAKWLDMLGGAWNVQLIIDEERATYAAWGLGLGSTWYVLNPATQVASWKVEGWLGQKVATAVKKSEDIEKKAQAIQARRAGKKGNAGLESPAEEQTEDGPTTTMGNKWQQAGAWAVNQRGTIVWGGRTKSADEIMDLDAAVRALGF
ncbi:hypothetical protein MKZ38_001211 [Zalerion maritima]|uniref:Alkyl hydroperoxide reductase subunit C/ Thiol specific antioxidant domain-containing protein n=1 Tax=Zalerion maritima TaxID=339359 RepID=A0AAD5WV18_9PEZI|nr:hypothetical protein MKZ38_001211 [Zalerion maritima]